MTSVTRGYLLTVSLVLFIAGMTTAGAYAQDIKPTRQAAEAAWNAGDYEKAYQNYNGLLLIYSRDPQYAYYAGACLVELKRDNSRALTLLNSALHSSQSVKNIPDEIWLYYGRALKLEGNCTEAVNAIEKYKKLAGKKRALEMGVQRYIDECAGNYTVENNKPGEIKTSTKSEENNGKKKKDTRSDNSKDLVRLTAYADRYQSRSDSLLRIAEAIRSKIDSSPEDVKGLMKSRVVELEEQAGYYLSSADSIRQVLGIETQANNYVTQKPLPGATAPDSNFVQADIPKTETKAEQAPVTDTAPVAAAETKQTAPVEISTEYDSQLTKAMHLQYLADSLNRAAGGLRRQSVAEPEETKRMLSSKATAMEAEAVRYQSEADKILLALEPDVRKTPDNKDVQGAASFTVTGNETKTNEANNKKVIQPVTEVQPVAPDKRAVYSCFEIKDKPFYSNDNPLPAGRKIKEGLIYHIQLAALRNPVTPSYFRNLYPVFGVLNAAKGVTYYYTGMFRTHDAAAQSLPAVKNNGFSDAFIVAFIDDVQVSMEKAGVAEKQWADKPLYYENIQEAKPVTNEGASAGTLALRAEVMRYTKPLKPEVIERIELLAGTKKLDIIKNNKGESIVLIGNFITFDSADEYVSLLKRNGYSTARVVAYVGNNEMPVGKAKELLNTTLHE
jgi:hypothetical protein